MNTTEAITEANPARLIDAANDIGSFASTDETRYVLNGIHLAPNYTEATNGMVCIRVPYSPISASEFPATNTPPTLTDCIVPVKPLREALKNAASGKFADDSALRCVKVSNNGKINLVSSDLENERLITAKAVDGQYPNIDQVIPTAEPTLSIALAGDLLKLIAEYAIKQGQETNGRVAVNLHFTDGLSAARFSINLPDGRKATGVIMPMRLS